MMKSWRLLNLTTKKQVLPGFSWPGSQTFLLIPAARMSETRQAPTTRSRIWHFMIRDPHNNHPVKVFKRNYMSLRLIYAIEKNNAEFWIRLYGMSYIE